MLVAPLVSIGAPAGPRPLPQVKFISKTALSSRPYVERLTVPTYLPSSRAREERGGELASLPDWGRRAEREGNAFPNYR